MGYGIMAVLMIVLLIFWVFMQETIRWKTVHEKREKRLGVVEAIRSLGRRDLLYVGVASLVYLMWTISFKLVTTWSGFFFTSILPDPTQFRTILTIGGLLLPISALISGILLEKVGRNFTLILGTVGSIICFILLGFTFMPAFFWGIFFFMAMTLAWIYAYVTEIFPTKVRSSSVGIAVTASRLGYVLAPLIAAVMLLNFGLPSITGNWLFFWVVAGLFMIFPLLSFLTKPYETKGKELETIDKEK